MTTEQGKPGLLVLIFDKTTWGENGKHPGPMRLVTLPYYGYQEKSMMSMFYKTICMVSLEYLRTNKPLIG